MGGAVSALSQNSDAIHYNTASGAFSSKTIFGFTHHEMYQGLKYNNYSYITKIKDNLVCGVNLKMVSTSKIDKTRIEPGSFFRYYNEGTFIQKDLALIYGMGYKLNEPVFIFNSAFDFAIGANVKIINSKIDIYEAIGYTTDWSIYFQKEYFNFSVNVSNLFGKLKYVKEEEKLPFAAKFGIGIPFKLNNSLIQFGIDWTKLSGDNNYFNTGIEIELINNFVCRAGFDSRNQAGNGYSFGFGWTTAKELDLIDSVSFNYAYSHYGDLGDINSFDLSILF